MAIMDFSFSVLCGDFVYVIVFPQLLLVLYFEQSNTYGSVLSFAFGLLLRLLCKHDSSIIQWDETYFYFFCSGGEKTLGLETVMSFGQICSADTFNDQGKPECGPLPFRTFVMLISLAIHLAVSGLTHYLFTREKLSPTFDFLHCYKKRYCIIDVAYASRNMTDTF